jgi:hypothetical protein
MAFGVEILLAIALTLCLIGLVQGHGRLIDPPGRSSMWRYGYRNPPNYNDNQLYCGGVQVMLYLLWRCTGNGFIPTLAVRVHVLINWVYMP